MNYQEALVWLYSLQRFGIKLGLENIQRLIAELHVDLATGRVRVAAATGLAGARVIHVAGTNGKGSVCAMIDSICRAQKYRTGLFTSPHLVTFRERIRVNGEMISKDAVASDLTSICSLVASWDPYPTFFEIATALALKFFSEAKIDIVILETGMGGRLDATNAVQSNVSVITPIDLDHQQWLGDSLDKIAFEKAGIIKPKIPVVSASQKEEVEVVVQKRAAKCGAPIEFVTAPHEQHPIALIGIPQKLNAALAIAALRAAKIDIDDSAIAHGLATIDWPARFQKWDERTIIDGAHNPAAAQILAETWRENFGDQRATLILAILSDKDLRGICEALVPIADSVLLPKIRSERAAPPEELAKVLSATIPSLQNASPARTSIAQSVAEALDQARTKSNPILITGSLHFAGEALAYLRGEPAAFEECAQ
ncbi:MAG TPA: folylpolyglutamate synthase/dihydrofolate synthase family protein [Chthoniobacterales bacterium]|nr:folylpolyglutamate synthase/dihydrofolate synthase family protein [Chthoniobacterales bacterium]